MYENIPFNNMYPGAYPRSRSPACQYQVQQQPGYQRTGTSPISAPPDVDRFPDAAPRRGPHDFPFPKSPTAAPTTDVRGFGSYAQPAQAVVDQDPFNYRSDKARRQAEYRMELERQIREKEERKRLEKQQREMEERRAAEEAMRSQVNKKGGGGDPVLDDTGRRVTVHGALNSPTRSPPPLDRYDTTHNGARPPYPLSGPTGPTGPTGPSDPYGGPEGDPRDSYGARPQQGGWNNEPYFAGPDPSIAAPYGSPQQSFPSRPSRRDVAPPQPISSQAQPRHDTPQPIAQPIGGYNSSSGPSLRAMSMSPSSQKPPKMSYDEEMQNLRNQKHLEFARELDAQMEERRRIKEEEKRKELEYEIREEEKIKREQAELARAYEEEKMKKKREEEEKEEEMRKKLKPRTPVKVEKEEPKKPESRPRSTNDGWVMNPPKTPPKPMSTSSDSPKPSEPSHSRGLFGNGVAESTRPPEYATEANSQLQERLKKQEEELENLKQMVYQSSSKHVERENNYSNQINELRRLLQEKEEQIKRIAEQQSLADGLKSLLSPSHSSHEVTTKSEYVPFTGSSFKGVSRSTPQYDDSLSFEMTRRNISMIPAPDDPMNQSLAGSSRFVFADGRSQGRPQPQAGSRLKATMPTLLMDDVGSESLEGSSTLQYFDHSSTLRNHDERTESDHPQLMMIPEDDSRPSSVSSIGVAGRLASMKYDLDDTMSLGSTIHVDSILKRNQDRLARGLDDDGMDMKSEQPMDDLERLLQNFSKK